MSVTFRITLACKEHPKYTGERKNSHFNSLKCGCYEVYSYQRIVYWVDDSSLETIKIEEVRHNG